MREVGEFFYDDADQDTQWKREGEYTIKEKRWLQKWTEALRVERKQWLVERVRCKYCNFYHWPHEMDDHHLHCKARY